MSTAGMHPDIGAGPDREPGRAHSSFGGGPLGAWLWLCGQGQPGGSDASLLIPAFPLRASGPSGLPRHLHGQTEEAVQVARPSAYTLSGRSSIIIMVGWWDGRRGGVFSLRSLRREGAALVSPEEADREDAEFWRSQTPDERFAALELSRQINYGYDPTARGLSRFFEVVEFPPR